MPSCKNRPSTSCMGKQAEYIVSRHRFDVVVSVAFPSLTTGASLDCRLDSCLDSSTPPTSLTVIDNSGTYAPLTVSLPGPRRWPHREGDGSTLLVLGNELTAKFKKKHAKIVISIPIVN